MSPEPMPLWEGEREEWAFRVDGMRALRPVGLSEAPELSDYLEQRIAAEPSHLLHHIRRIALAYQLDRPESLYGALIDLFLVLGTDGRALRRRMTEGARARLLPEHHAHLTRWLQDSTLSAESVPPLRSSLFGLGMGEMLHLVETREISDPDTRDPLVEARECIEYSQIDEARQILESALAAQPERADLQWELLDLYRAQRDASHFLKLYTTFATDENPLAEDWRATARFLKMDKIQ
ncbi:MAG TPA: hypothetical protein VI457_14375 [Methylococcaceae bacterium]|nr:hypothetical protein [Methylococcaceae bacterium]